MRSENMKSSAIEKRIVKIDQAVQAMNIAKKYLTNHDEIKAVVLELNRERQLLVNDLYRDDKQNYTTVREHLETLIDNPPDHPAEPGPLPHAQRGYRGGGAPVLPLH